MADLSIAAVIPLYNGARWIERTIQSVFTQTLQPDEFIVVDDGSTDGGAGAAIVERLAQERPITLLRKPNGGQSSARNFGVAHSTSALIALLDQDDIWYPAHLERLVEPFRQQRSAPLGWVCSNLDLVDENGAMLVRGYLGDVRAEQPKRSLRRCLGEDMHVLPSASLINRAAFEAIGGFDERLSGYEDDDLFLRLFIAGYENVFIDEALSQWRMVSDSSGHSHRMFRSGLIYADKLFRRYPDHENIVAWRFAHRCLGKYARAARAGNSEHQRDAVAALVQFLPRLGLTKRIALRCVIPVLQWRPAGRLMLNTIAHAVRLWRGSAVGMRRSIARAGGS
jgi:glycosyltransferase involved in cell wall biosynthesis